jgi:predicted nucleic acid-binding protein
MPNDTFLVDTSAWLFALRKGANPEVKSRLDTLLREDAVVITGIIKLELLGGTRTREEFSRLKSRLDGLKYIPLEEPLLWDLASEMAFDLRRKGLTIPYTDILIASAAIEENLILLHADVHFDQVARHSKLRVESFVNRI